MPREAPVATGSEVAQRWDGAAEEWSRHADRIDAEAAPVTAWMLAATAPAPGETVLELGAGPAGVGLQAARAVTPGGRVVITDVAPAMLEIARARARARALDAVEFEAADAVSLPLPDASADAALCRYALQAMSDPARALREMLRVLRPGGRLALAVWGRADRNPGIETAMATIREAMSEPAAPAPPAQVFSLADETRLRSLVTEAGFDAVRIEHVCGEHRYDCFESWWDLRRRLPPGAQPAWEALPADARAAMERRLRSRVDRYRRDGGYAFPWDALVASATR